jgi:hypothetical protein
MAVKASKGSLLLVLEFNVPTEIGVREIVIDTNVCGINS